MVPGTRKIPLPMTVPTTIAVAWLTPNSRSSSGRSCPTVVLCMIGQTSFSEIRKTRDHAHNISNRECHRCPYRHVPGPGDGRELPDANFCAKPSQHTHG